MKTPYTGVIGLITEEEFVGSKLDLISSCITIMAGITCAMLIYHFKVKQLRREFCDCSWEIFYKVLPKNVCGGSLDFLCMTILRSTYSITFLWRSNEKYR